jgi:DNA polymerase III delta prime subunit
MRKSDAHRCLVVELCGLPGVGKTTTAHRLLRDLRDRGYPIQGDTSPVAPAVPVRRRVTTKAVLAFAETLTHPAATASGVLSIARSNQPSTAAVLRRALQWTVTQRLLRVARNQAGVHIFDEGALQALWSIGLRGSLDPVLRDLNSSSAWASPDLVAVVDAPVEVVRDRLQARGSRHARSQSLDSARQQAELERGRRLLDELVAWWCAWNDADRIIRVPYDANVSSRLTSRILSATHALAEPSDRS